MLNFGQIISNVHQLELKNVVSCIRKIVHTAQPAARAALHRGKSLRCSAKLTEEGLSMHK